MVGKLAGRFVECSTGTLVCEANLVVFPLCILGHPDRAENWPGASIFWSFSVVRKHLLPMYQEIHVYRTRYE